MTTGLFLNIVTASPPAAGGAILDALGHHPARRIPTIFLIAAAAHVIVVVVRRLFQALLQTSSAGHTKMQTQSHFASSVIIFSLYFAAAGMILHELGVSLTAYVASATVIGFAVSFGSQGIIQDVITSLTVITSDLIDVGFGGQIGLVERVGIRHTVLVDLRGARIFIPNRNVANVINVEDGYSRVFLDAWLPQAEDKLSEAVERLRVAVASAFEQFRGSMLLARSVKPAGDAGGVLVRPGQVHDVARPRDDCRGGDQAGGRSGTAIP